MSLSRPEDAERVVLEFPASATSVGRLVLGGLAARFELPVDRVDDVLLAVESLLMQDLASEEVTLEATVADEGLIVRLGPFARPPLDEPAARRVVTPLVDDVTQSNGPDGAWVELLVSAAHVRVG